jgi:hypothetical protein
MATRNTTPAPGPKPLDQVVEHSLHSQTDDGEIVLDLRVPIDQLELMMETLDGDGLEPQKIPRFLLDRILPKEDAEKLRALKDGARAYQILMGWSQQVGKRMGASLGESQSSTDSSESTEQPSGTTSEPASE